MVNRQWEREAIKNAAKDERLKQRIKTAEYKERVRGQLERERIKKQEKKRQTPLFVKLCRELTRAGRSVSRR